MAGARCPTPRLPRTTSTPSRTRTIGVPSDGHEAVPSPSTGKAEVMSTKRASDTGEECDKFSIRLGVTLNCGGGPHRHRSPPH